MINNKMDLVISFDTTGSMYPVLAQVRREVEEFVKNMFKEFTDLRLSIIAHGDYCDKDDPYTIRVMDFTRDEDKLCEFVRETKQTYGGDADECYELVLKTAHTELNWREDADKLMILIGDAAPHGKNYRLNTEGLDWEEEAVKLAKDGVKIFAVHALSYYRVSSRGFYKAISKATDGIYLTLDQFNEIIDLIKATCYQQGGEEKLNEYVTIIRDSGRMTHSMENNIKRLRGEEIEETYERYFGSTSKERKLSRMSSEDVTIKEMGELVPVLPGRFQVMTVDENCAIKEFVEKNGIEFKKGRGFYELSKAETVQQYKEVIMQDRETGEMFNGSQVRERLGLQPQSEKGGVNERLHKADAEKFRVFVQSTSVNRKLIGGTTFLYEISDMEDVGSKVEASVETAKTEKKTETKAKAEKKEVKRVDKKVDFEYETSKSSKIKDTVSDVLDKKTHAKKIVTTAKAEKALKKTEAPKKDLVAKPLENSEKQLEKVIEALSRFKDSRNKKNTTFLKNNATKMIKELQSLLDAIEE